MSDRFEVLRINDRPCVVDTHDPRLTVIPFLWDEAAEACARLMNAGDVWALSAKWETRPMLEFLRHTQGTPGES